MSRGTGVAGVRGRRNPLPLTYVDDPDAKERFWYFATSNNCLVQIDEDEGSHVWLPTYGHGAWEDLRRTKRIARSGRASGSRSTSSRTSTSSPRTSGLVHCIKKYLARS